MSDRDRVNQRIRHLRDHTSNFPSYNIRSILGTDSVFDLLKYGEFTALHGVEDRLIGGGTLQTVYDVVDQSQSRELYVPLTGSGVANGRLEFEVEREHGGLKYELTIKVRNAAAGEHFVRVDGVQIGTIAVGGNGYGRLELSSAPGGGELAFPGGVVPGVKLGSVVEIGSILSATIGEGFGSTDGSVSTAMTRLNLTGSTALAAFVEYEVEPEDGGLKKELKVDVRNATPGATLDFYANGTDYADILVDDRGRGLVRFSTHPDQGEQAFPIGFPEIQVGTSLSVARLASGTFSSLPSTVPGGVSPAEVEFQGGLTGSTAARGGARFELQLEDGGFLEHQFRVHVRNAIPGTQHPIRVDGLEIGSLSIGTDGRGIVDFSNRMDDPRELALPANFPTVLGGTRVDVGVILTGFLMPQTNLTAGVPDGGGSLGQRSTLPWEQPAGLGLAAGP